MIKGPRNKYNQSFSTEKYNGLVEEIHKEFPGMLDFRIAESPVFVDRDLKIKILGTCSDIIDQIKKQDFIEKTDRSIPDNRKVAGTSTKPGVLAIDFAVSKDENDSFTPQLIELQGFPSLFAYQSYLASKYKKHFDIDRGYSEFFNRLNTISYQQEMQKFLLRDAKPENTILLEIFPEKQKTRLDFALTQKYWGIEPVCLTKIKKLGKDLFYEKDGKKITIDRIYNRLIFDDLDRNFLDLKVDFDFQSEISASWVCHPDWFYRVSKFSMPLFKSKYIPETQYLSDFDNYPQDLENYVLKPLFSFAGAGVKIDLTLQDLENIKDPNNYILQKKIEYFPAIKDINGNGVKSEIRMLYIWPEGSTNPKLMTNLARLSRGKMIGVDFNKNFDWVGGSAAFFETN